MKNKNNQSNVMSQSHTSDQQKLKMNQQSKSLYNSFPKIFQNTKEFEKLEYLLQMKLQNYQVKVKVIYKIENENNSLSSTGIRLDSWIFIDNLVGDNKIADILKSNFHFKENQGQVFTSGMMKLSPELEKQVKSASTDQQSTFEIIICEIAPGSSFVDKTGDSDGNVTDRLTKDKLPEGFDSFVLQNTREGAQQEVLQEEDDADYLEDDAELDQQYLYEYVLFGTDQVQPKFVMQVEIRPPNKDHPVCNNCGADATHYCFNDVAYFCAQCDQKEHMPDGNFQDGKREGVSRRMEHERVRLEQSGPPMVLPECSQHQGNKTELYCTNCHEALCVLCVIGNDGKNNNQAQKKHQNHRICQLKQVYDDAKMDSTDINQEIEGRNSILKKELDSINLQLMNVHKQSKTIIEEIYKKHVATLKKLQSITDHKIQKLQSWQMEVQRQINQLDYGENFLKSQLHRHDPINYLKGHTRHVEYRKDVVAQQKDGSGAILTKPCELSVQGEIYIEDGQKNYSHHQQTYSHYDQPNQGSEGPQSLYRKNIMVSQNMSQSNEQGFFGAAHFSENNKYEQQGGPMYQQQGGPMYQQQGGPMYQQQGSMYQQQGGSGFSPAPYQFNNSSVPTQKQPSGVFAPKKSNIANKNMISQFEGGSTAKREKHTKVAFE